MPRWEFSSHPATGTTMEPQALQKLELLQKERHWADFEYNLLSRGESYHWPSLTIIDMSCWFTSLGCHFCYVELVLTAYSGVCCCELCLGQDFPSVGGAYSVYISDIAMSVAWWFQFASIFWLVISYMSSNATTLHCFHAMKVRKNSGVKLTNVSGGRAKTSRYDFMLSCPLPIWIHILNGLTESWQEILICDCKTHARAHSFP